MKLESNRWMNTIFTRLLITFLAIMVPIFFFSVNMYSWGLNTLHERILDSMKAQVSFSVRNFESEIQRIQISMYNSVSDQDLLLLAFAANDINNFEKSQAVSRLVQRLSQMKLSSRYIENVTIYIPLYKGAVSSNNYFETLDEKSFNKYSNMMSDEGNYFIKSDHGEYLVLKSTQKLSQTTTHAFILVVKLSEEAIKDTLSELEPYGLSMLYIKTKNNELDIIKNSQKDITEKIQSLVTENLQEKESGILSYNHDGKKYSVIYQSSSHLNAGIVSFTEDNQVFKPLQKFKAMFLIFMFCGVIVIILYAFSTHKFINKPLSNLVNAFRKVEVGNLNVRIEHKQNNEFKYLYHRFNDMVENLNTLIEQGYKQKLLTQKATLKQLQSQIDPHFLYNSFFILHRMIKKEDMEHAQAFSKELGSYFKVITRNAADEIPLSQEVEHAKTYCSIQGIRFSRRITIDFGNLPDEFSTILVPRLILQPIIENAFEHGLRDKVSNGLLYISFERIENGLSIIVEDNGDDLFVDQLEKLRSDIVNLDEDIENTALINIHKRISLHFGEDSGITLTRGNSGGLKVIIRIRISEVV